MVIQPHVTYKFVRYNSKHNAAEMQHLPRNIQRSVGSEYVALVNSDLLRTSTFCVGANQHTSIMVHIIYPVCRVKHINSAHFDNVGT